MNFDEDEPGTILASSAEIGHLREAAEGRATEAAQTRSAGSSGSQPAPTGGASPVVESMLHGESHTPPRGYQAPLVDLPTSRAIRPGGTPSAAVPSSGPQSMGDSELEAGNQTEPGFARAPAPRAPVAAPVPPPRVPTAAPAPPPRATPAPVSDWDDEDARATKMISWDPAMADQFISQVPAPSSADDQASSNSNPLLEWNPAPEELSPRLEQWAHRSDSGPSQAGGRPAAASGGFPNPRTTGSDSPGGFGQSGSHVQPPPAPNVDPRNSYGQPGANVDPRGGYGQPASSQDSRGGYGQPASSQDSRGGYGQPASNVDPRSGYGQPASSQDSRGGHWQPASNVDPRSGYGQPASNVDPRSGGYGQVPSNSDVSGGYGQSGGWGDPRTSGYGSSARSGNWTEPPRSPSQPGFGQSGGYATPPASTPGSLLEAPPAWSPSPGSSTSMTGQTPMAPRGHLPQAATMQLPPAGMARPPEQVAPQGAGGSRRLLLVGLLALVVVAAGVGIFMTLHRQSAEPAGPMQTTLDTVPGGAQVTFKDGGRPPGHTPMSIALKAGESCVAVEIRHDGYELEDTCLPVNAQGLIEPKVLRPATRATDVVFYFPLDVSGLTLSIDDWDVDMRQRISRPGNQASVRTYISLARHKISARSPDCGEVVEDVDFTSENAYKFMKLIRGDGSPCTLKFLHE